MIRWTTIVGLLAVLLGAIGYDRASFAPEPVQQEVAAPVRTPVLRDPVRQSTVWYCPTGSSDEGGFADHSVVVTNIGETPVAAEVALVSGEGAGPALKVAVEPLTSEVVKLSDLATNAQAGAVVDIVGGNALVSHQVVTATGSPSGPCHTSLAESWYLASGSTTRDSHNYIVLLNPFSSDVVFTATFQTESRTREPADLDRAVVPGRSVRVIDVGEYVSREAIVATTITTVQGGRLAVEQLQTRSGELGPVGASLNLGVATPATTWTFPAGRLIRGGDNRIEIFNPNDTVAQVDLQLDPLDPTDRATYGLVPIELTIQPGRVQSLDLSGTLDDYTLPYSYELGITAVSTNGVPVVVDRWQLTPAIDTSLIGAGGDSASDGDAEATGDPTTDSTAVAEEPVVEEPAVDEPVDPETALQEADIQESIDLIRGDPALAPPAQPDPTIGITGSHGVSELSDRWVIPQMATLDGERSVVVVSAPAGALVEIRMVVAGEILDPVRVSVPASGRAMVVLDPVAASAVVMVQADAPIAAVGVVVDPGVDYQLIAGIPVL